MRVLIVAKTRRGGGACVGGITWDGRSVRLIAADADTNERAGLEYSVGDLWEIDATLDPHIIPPHVENIIVRAARRHGCYACPETMIRQHMPPVTGGPALLFDGLLQASPFGPLFIAERTGLPSRSTMFWVADQPMRLDFEGKRIRYRYPSPDGGRTLTFVGFQEPVEMIPAGTLLRVSLAHWWRPREKPEEELRCYVQLSGWYNEKGRGVSLSGPVLAPGFGAQTKKSQPPGPHQLANACVPAGDLDSARQVLKHTFGFAEFLPVQEDVVRRAMQRLDGLVIMPTGGGKSLCYQLPALLLDGLTMVVSPLIALMQDQVAQLRELDVPAAFLNSTLQHHEYLSVANRARGGLIKILYAAPETVLRPETLLLLEQCHLSCLAIDEAHCISEWGHDFRPEYRQLHEVRRRFPNAFCLALTATATERVRQDIRRLLGIEAAGEFVASFNRPNLFLAVEPRQDGLGQALKFLEKHRDESGIIYCATRQQVDQLSAELQARHWPALPYHAGLNDDVRRQNQERFIRDEAPIMVATVAFGMGINKSNVRFVLHYNLPKDIESYYQEIGRAGRDGLEADCLLLHSRKDAITIRRFIDEGAPSERPGRQARLEALIRYAEAPECRRIPLLSYFGETLSAPCGHCDKCQGTREPQVQTDGTEAAQKFLSCVKRAGEVFGPSHIVDVLRGSRSEKVISRGHDRLSTYGIGLEFSARQWRDLARQFISQGLVEQDLQFGGLRLTPKAWQVFKGEKVFVTLKTETSRGEIEKARSEHDRELFERLRVLRRQLADEAGVPPYIVFSDRSLVEMAASFPRTEQQFLAINGVGEAKLANYGAAFLEAIAQYCDSRDLAPHDNQIEGPVDSTAWVTVRRHFEEIGELFGSGRSLDELAELRGVQRRTIVQNLWRYCQSGGPVDPVRVLASSGLLPADQERAIKAFEELGLGRLSPIHEALAGQIPYDELHLLRLYVACRPSQK